MYTIRHTVMTIQIKIQYCKTYYDIKGVTYSMVKIATHFIPASI